MKVESLIAVSVKLEQWQLDAIEMMARRGIVNTTRAAVLRELVAAALHREGYLKPEDEVR